MDLDTLLRELSDIHTRLQSLSEDALDERSRLQDRRAELRHLAGEIADADPETITQITERIRYLEQRRDRVLGDRLSPSAAAQTGMGGGIDPEYVHQMNRQMSEAADLDGIQEELARLRERLRTLTEDAGS